MVNPHCHGESAAPPPPTPTISDTQRFDPVPSSGKRSGRKAMWITIVAVVVVAAVAVPVILDLTRGEPPRLKAPAQLAGLNRDNQSNAIGTANYLQNAIAAGMGLRNAVGAVYTDGRGDAHSVIFVGGASSDGSEVARLARIFGLLDDATDGVTALTTEPAGSLGGTVKCGLATDANSETSSPPADTEMAICGWADGQTVAIAMFPNRPIAEAAALLRRMRSDIQGD